MKRLETRRSVRRHWIDHPIVNVLIFIGSFIAVVWYAVDIADRTETRLSQRHGGQR